MLFVGRDGRLMPEACHKPSEKKDSLFLLLACPGDLHPSTGASGLLSQSG